VNGSYCYSNDG